MTQMNLASKHLIKIVESIRKSKTIMAVHLCNNYEALRHLNIKHEIFTILGLNYTRYKNYAKMKYDRMIQARNLFKNS